MTLVARVARGELPTFSRKELGVLRLVCKGVATHEIAKEMRIAPKTIDSIRARVMDKTHTDCATALVGHVLSKDYVDAATR